ncbi:MAG: aminotransferase class V-fold PLP-dependent enzyme [Solirubrobacteraceae bacterium]
MGPGALSIPEARRLFSPELTWLNTASYGLPPRPSWEAMQAAGDEWRHGRCGFDGWDLSVGAARESFARLHGVPAADVAIGPQVSPFAGLVALSVPRGARVVCPQEDFTSLLFPFLAQRPRGVRVDLVPLDELAGAVDGGTEVVAFSAVQSADGRVADLDGLAAAAAHHGARTYVDATHACGWMPFEVGRFDYAACAGYKWLLGPRGTAFFAVRPEAAERLTPHLAGWYAAEVPMATLYGGPLRLAGDARRLDVSPAWLNWVAHAPALALLERVGIAAIHAHDLALANRFRAGLGVPDGDSPIVSVALDDGAGDRLRAAGVMAAGRGGAMRFSFHLYTTEADVDRTLDVLI